MMTQEMKQFLQNTPSSCIEQTRNLIKAIHTQNEIEIMFVEDLLIEISSHTEKEYENSVEESGVFYFFNDNEIRRT